LSVGFCRWDFPNLSEDQNDGYTSLSMKRAEEKGRGRKRKEEGEAGRKRMSA
jgi:hypothetical protein